MDKKINTLQVTGFTAIGIAIAGLCYVIYRIDDSKIVKVLSVKTAIEKASGFKNTEFQYVHRDGQIDSKSVIDKFDRPLSKVAAKNGCVKMELAFPDWYFWQKYRGLVDFKEVKCPF